MMEENDEMEYYPERRKKMPPVNGRNEAWRWLVGILVSLLVLIGGLVIADNKSLVAKTETKVEQMQEKKLDKETYYRDIADIKETLKDIDRKVDAIRKEIK